MNTGMWVIEYVGVGYVKNILPEHFIQIDLSLRIPYQKDDQKKCNIVFTDKEMTKFIEFILGTGLVDIGLIVTKPCYFNKNNTLVIL